MTKTTNVHRMLGSCLFPVAVLYGAAIVAGCGSSGDGGSGADPGASDVCSAIGSKAKECNSSADETTIVANCENEIGTKATKLRANAVSSIESCVQASDCAHVATAITDCLDTAKAEIAPSAAATTLCADAAKADMTCSSTTFADQASCLDAAKIFGDSALEAADQCMSHSCANIASCVSATLGGLVSISGSSGSSSTGNSGSSGSSSSGSSGTRADCQPYLKTTTACGACMEQNCCAQAAACFTDASCSACARGGTCSNDPATTDFNGCIASACKGACP